MLFAGDMILGAAELIDASDSGARMTADRPEWLLQATFSVNPGRAEAHAVALIWRKGSVRPNATGLR